MQFYIDQKLISIKGRFFITDLRGNDMYEAVGKAITFGRQLTVSDMQGKQVLFIKQKVFSAHNTYYITPTGGKEMKIIKKIVAITPQFVIKDLGWVIKGDITGHEYNVQRLGKTIARVSKNWISVTDKYIVDVANDADVVNVLGAVLAIECVCRDNIMQSSSVSTAVQPQPYPAK